MITFARLVYFRYLLVIGMGVCGSAGYGQALSPAPLNPAFVDYMAAKKASVPGKTKHGFGFMPAPVDPAAFTGRVSTVRRTKGSFAASYDLRTTGKLTPVRDQGTNGTCWAHAACASLESWMLPGSTNNYSENNMVNKHGFDWGFDSGGNNHIVMAYLLRWDGPVNESDDPYPNPGGSPAGAPVRKHVQQVIRYQAKANALDHDAIKQALLDHGAVAVDYYHENAYYNATYKSYRFTGTSNCNHGVCIVGWDDNFDKSKFVSPPASNGAYIVRNNWGTGWGESGYFYVSYYDTKMGYSEVYSYQDQEATNNYTLLYSYDRLGWINNMGVGASNMWAAAIYTASNSDSLYAAGFYAVTLNTDYELYVYTGVSAGAPRSGTLAAAVTGTCAYSGYYTVVLGNPPALTAGQRFSVVLKTGTYGYTKPQAYQYAIAGYSSGSASAPGQNYYSSAGSSWSDLNAWNASASFCIKAYSGPPPDIAPPAFSAIAVNPSSARLGTLVTNTFIASEPLGANPLVLINGHSASYSSASGTNYTYTYTVSSADTNGFATLVVVGADVAGNIGATTNTTALSINRDSANLSVAKTADRSSATPGETVTYRVVVSNAGPDAASGVQVSDPLPARVTYMSHAGGSYVPGTGLWTLGALAVNGATSLTIQAAVQVLPAGAVITNRASLAALDGIDPVPANDASSALVTGLAITNTYVATNGSHTFPYTSWATAASNIQAAVNVTSTGGTVRVGDGVYASGGAPVYGMNNRVALTQAVTVVSVNGPGTTFIVGQGPNGASAIRCAYLTNGAVLAGFTLTNGHTFVSGDVFKQRSGGGVNMEGGVVSNCVIAGSGANDNGGGVFLKNSALLVNCTVNGSSASWGGGVYLAGSALAANCIVSGNSAINDGGGTFFYGGGAMRNSLVCSNSATRAGGAFFLSAGIVLNCTISGNSASGSGGGIFTDTGGTLANTIVYSNTAPNGFNLSNKNAGVSFTNCCSVPLPSPGSGNITNNPQFVSFGARNYRLAPGSPCVNAGINQAWMTGALDLDGRSRIIGSTVDMGAYELPFCDLAITKTVDRAAALPGDTVTYTLAVSNAGPVDASGVQVTDPLPAGAAYAAHSGGSYVPGSGLWTIGTLAPNAATSLTLQAVAQGLPAGTPVTNLASFAAMDQGDSAGANNAAAAVFVLTNPVITASAGPYGTISPSGSVPVPYGTDQNFVISSNLGALLIDVAVDGVSVGATNAYTFMNVTTNHTIAASFAWVGVVTTYAATNGSHTYPYSTWATAASNIQAAVDATAVSGTVWVNDGVYNSGAATVYGVSNRVALTRAVTVCSVNGPGSTLIVGKGPLGSGAIRCAYLTNGAVLAGFTLTNGFTLTTGDQFVEMGGGGALLDRGGVISSSVIVGCSATYNGGGVVCYRGGTIRGCEIRGNSAFDGGGAICYLGGLVENCMVRNNSAFFYGGGVSLRSSGATMRNCVLVNNTSGNKGGGCYMEYGGGQLLNSTIISNRATNAGGGVGSWYGGAVVNSIIVFNSAGTSNNYCIEQTPVSYDHCCTFPAVAGTGNITNDPQFVNFASGNYRLKPTSPCIDAGVNQAWMTGALDLDGRPRIAGGGIVDMGAYELPVCDLAVTKTADVSSILPGDLVTYTLGVSNAGPDAASGVQVSDMLPAAMAYASHTGGSYVPGSGLWDIGSLDAGATTSLTLRAVAQNLADIPAVTNTASIAALAEKDPNGANDSASSVLQRGTLVITASAGPYGTISPSGSVQVAYGASQGFAIVTNIGARVLDVVVDGVSIGATNAYTFTGVTSNHAIAASFAWMGVTTAYAATNGSHTFPYTNWATAASNIQAAVDAVAISGTVWVGDGVYDIGVVSIYGANNRVALTQAVTVCSVNGPGSTFIKGQGPLGASAIRCAYLKSGAVLAGFTLTNGFTKTSGGIEKVEAGGGVWLDQGGLVSNCVMIGNSASSRGGGALCYYGGTVSGCRITGNTSSSDGGGSHCDHSGTVVNCLITSNTAAYGGGSYTWYGGTVVNCTLVGNRATSNGGGVFTFSGGTIVNSIFYGNVSPSSINWSGGSGNYMNCCSIPMPSPGTGNITNSPLFGNAAAGDFRLWATSPCIDAGVNQAWMTGATDLAGNPRLGGNGIVDMGAYEGAYDGPGCDLAVTMIDDKDTVYPGDSVTFTLGISNAGPDAASGVKVSDPLPVGLSYSSHAGGSYVPGTGLWDIGTLTVGATTSLTIQAILQNASFGPVINRASIASLDQGDPGEGNNSATAVVMFYGVQTSYVSTNGSHTYPYTNWVMAASNIQAAVEVLTNGGSCWVDDGVYTAGCAVVYGFSNRVALLKPVTVQSVHGPERTVIVGAAHDGGNGSTAMRCAYVTNGAVLAGFTLTNGHTLTTGGDNLARSGGGALLDRGGVVSNCMLVANGAYNGGAVMCYNGGVVRNCSLRGNIASSSGGAIYFDSGGSIRNSTLTGNRSIAGGAIYFNTGTAESCTISSNSASVYGGGFYGTRVTMVNSIVYSNTAPTYPNWRTNSSGSTFTKCCMLPLPSNGTGNMTNDPLFVNAEAGNFRLLADSPCVDAGSYQSWMTAAVDLDGKPRLAGNGTVDIGAYELPLCNLAIGKAIDRNQVFPGDTVTYTLAVSNAGPNNATDVQVSDPLPAGAAYASHSGGSYDPGTGLWTVGALAVNATTSLTLQAVAQLLPGGTPVTNLASVSALAGGDRVGSNDSATAVFVISNPVITASAGANGTVSPSGAVEAPYGTDQSFVIAPNLGFRVLDVVVDGSAIGATNAYTFMNVTTNHTIAASFAWAGVATAYAATNGSHTFPYATWATAASNIQAAVDAVAVSGTVWVSNGVYASGAATVYGMSNRVALTQAVTVCSVNGPGSTFIVGKGPLGAGAIRCAYLTNGAVLAGFTLTNGFTLTTGDQYVESGGGGALLNGGGIISNSIIAGCSACHNGGGVVCYKGGTVQGCEIRGNSSSSGGGAACMNGGLLENCMVRNNSASSYGGGVELRSLGATMRDCVVVNNTSGYKGGGCDMMYGGGQILNSTIISNRATNAGGGVGSWYGGTVVNSIIVFNSAGTSNNYCIEQTPLSYDYCCTVPAVAGTGNITNDPRFVNFAGGDYRLQAGSPCINAGTNQAWMAGATDLDGRARIFDGTVDMGAYESTGCRIIASAGAGGSINPAGTNWYAPGDTPSFIMTADAHQHLADVMVDGASVGALSPYTFTALNGSHAIAATFASDRVGLTVFSEHGSPVPAVGTQSNDWGADVTCSVQALDEAGTTQYLCQGWTLAGQPDATGAFSGTTTNVTLIHTNDAVLAWAWQTNVLLSSGVASGSGTLSGSTNGWYAIGSSVSVTAAPVVDWYFEGWTGDVPSGQEQANPLTMTMDQNRSVQATFRAMPSTTYVATNGLNQYPFETWGKAATTIQAAVDAVAVSGTVWVSNGVYASGGAAVNGMSNRVAITQAVTVCSVNGPGSTFIVGQGPNGVGAIRGAYLASGAVLAGFTVTNGHTRTSGDWTQLCSGGGILMDWGGLVSNCVVSGNAAYDMGGGIDCTANGTVQNSTISGNSALDGGGFYGGGTIQNSTVIGNEASSLGGGLFLNGRMQNCRVSGNVAQELGGGAYLASQSSIVVNSVVCGNTSSIGGGGLYLGAGTVRNCTVTGNDSDQGGGVFCDEATLDNMIAYANTASSGANWYNKSPHADYMNCCTVPAVAGTGNITNDPRFVNFAAGDYRLQAGSPCINAGTNQAWMAGATDLDGQARIFDGTVDIGAYESTACRIIASAGTGGSINPAGTNWYAAGDTPSFVMTADAHQHLADVTVDGASVGALSPYTFPALNGSHVIAATFASDRVGLTVFSEHGSPVPAVGTQSNDWGAGVTCSVQALDEAGTTQYLCQGWTLAGQPDATGAFSGTTTNVTLTHTNDAVLAWAWQTNVYFSSGVASGSGALSGSTNGWYAIDSSVTLTASPVAGWYFKNWSGDVPAGQQMVNPLNLALDRARTVQATFLVMPSTTYVSTSGLNQYPFETWETAASNIQAAVDAVAVSGTVWVSNGVYASGAATVYGMSNRVALTQAVTVCSVNGPGSTFIVGKGPLGAGAIRCAYLTNGAVLAGFTLTNGFTMDTGDQVLEGSGGGALLDCGGVIASSVIVGCSATYNGGGVICYKGGTVSDCELRGNASSSYGGGAECRQGGLIANCTIRDNSAVDCGGGIALVYGSGTMRNCLVFRNSSNYGGGGCYLGGSGRVLNSTIISNTDTRAGGGLMAWYGGAVSNTIMAFNSAGASNNYCNVGSGMSFGRCCTLPAVEGTGNITNDPQFVDFAAGDYRLQTGSPCINAGVNQAWMAGATDLDGRPRIAEGGTVDMGAYESIEYRIIASAGAGGSINPAGTNWYAAGGTPSFVMTADPHQHLADVTVDGDSVGAVSPYTFTALNGSHAIAATFASDRVGLTVFSEHGSPVPAAGTQSNDWGASLTCSVQALDQVGATQYLCQGWTLAGQPDATGAFSGTTPEVTLTHTNDAVLAWAWQTNVNFSSGVASGSGTLSGSTNGWYALGSSVNLTALPGAGRYVEWSGDVPAGLETVNPLTLVLDRARSVQAAFRILPSTTYVATNGLNLYPFETWGKAATTIQAAVEVVTVGGTVWVSNGVYASGGASAYGMSNRVALTRAVTVCSVNGPDSTFIMGASHNGTNGPSAMRCASLANGALLAGFTLTNGHTHVTGTWSQDEHGGGAYLNGGTISNCVLSGNGAAVNGGGAYVPAGLLRDSIVLGNRAGYGGGASVANGTVQHCTLTGNHAVFIGGGVNLGGTGVLKSSILSGNTSPSGGGIGSQGAVTIQNCTVNGNRAPGGYGGGVFFSGSGGAGTMQNCLINSNQASVGAGVWCQNGGMIRNCTLGGNIASSIAGGIGFLSGVPTVNNSIIYSNTAPSGPNVYGTDASFTNCCTIPLPSTGSGNITNNPRFVNSGAGNFRLEATSPCIDAGVNQDWMSGGFDLDGKPRIAGNGIVDIGAYEQTLCDVSVTKSADRATVQAGDTVTYTLTVSNAGPDAATGVQVSDPLPASVAYAGHVGGAYNPESGIWSVGSLPVGAGASLTISVAVQNLPGMPAEVTNRAAIAGLAEGDPVSSNDSAVAVFRRGPLSISASAGPNGTISPSGSLQVPYGTGQAFVIAPDLGFRVLDVVVDGSSIGATNAYTFTSVISNHTIAASFAWAGVATAYAATQGSHTFPYATWATAASNIQAAVDAVAVNGTVWVSNGVYASGGAAVNGMSNRVALTRAVTVCSVNGPGSTFIVGQGPNGDSAIRGAYLTSGAVLAGFTVTNGHTQTSGDWTRLCSGGGILMDGGGLVSNCVVAGNEAYSMGGGIDCIANGAVQNSTIRGNSAGDGGGFYGWGTIQNSTVSGNEAYDGGGLYLYGSMQNCRVSDNRAFGLGGGAYLEYSPIVMNSVVCGNTSFSGGGGLYLERGGTVRNCTVTGNLSSEGGGVCHNQEGTLVNVIVYDNTASSGANWHNTGTDAGYMNCCTVPSVGTGCLTNAPLFLNAAAGDYRLQPTSPSVDAGVNQDWMAGTLDLGGKARIIHGTVDIGAYESEWDTDGDGIPDWYEWVNGGTFTNLPADVDADGDGLNNRDEYEADTNPTNAQSCLEMVGLSMSGGALRIEWKGGRNAWQFLERASRLTPSPNAWVPVFTNPPPTAVNASWVDSGATNNTQFYRVRVSR